MKKKDRATDGQEWLRVLGAAFNKVAAQSQTVIMFFDGDTYSLSMQKRDPKIHRRTVVGTSLLDTVLELLDEERRKRCGTCKKIKLLAHFSADVSQADGHNRCCHLCERKRMKRYPR